MFPLKHTEVKARVSGNVSRVEVTQSFENPYDQPLEAIYVFPLPDKAAVDEMEIRLGERVIRGEIKRREEAQALYEQARRQGRTAGLLAQERDNIFTQSLANLKPGEQIQVTLRYSESLAFEGGHYEFVLPMVVGPRYIPGQPIVSSGRGFAPDTDQVPDGSRITPPVLPPGSRSGHEIGVSLQIDAGVPLGDIRSPSHRLRVQQQGNTASISLSPDDTIANKDLIVRYQVSQRQAQATVLTGKLTGGEAQGGHFAAYLLPALQYAPDQVLPKDLVFLVDTSGSMRGLPLSKCQDLMRQFIAGMNPEDSFWLLDFSEKTSQLAPAALPNTAANRQKALNYLNNLQPGGGTNMLEGIRTALNLPPQRPGRVRQIVLLTDGYIGNEREILSEIQQQLSPGDRVFSFGVGSSVNRYLLDRAAEVGRGAVQYLRPDQPSTLPVRQFFNQINNPVLTNLEVAWQGSGAAPEIYPAQLPDLFANQPLVLYGRKADAGSGELVITGTGPKGARFRQTVPVTFAGQSNAAIAQLWGRARIKDLMNQMFGAETAAGIDAVTRTALQYHLLSQYTAFIAVSEEVRVNPDGSRRTVQVPVELPEGVSYEGVFGSADSSRPTSFSGAGGRARATSAGPMPPASPSLPPRRPQAEAAAGSQTLRLRLSASPNLDRAWLESLEVYLSGQNLPLKGVGDLVLELRLTSQGRLVPEPILRVDEGSTLRDPALLSAVQQAIRRWGATAQPVVPGSRTVRLTLRVGA